MSAVALLCMQGKRLYSTDPPRAMRDRIAHKNIPENIFKYCVEVLCNIRIKIGIPVKPVILIKICLNETYCRVWVSKYLSDVFHFKNDLKQWNALSPLVFNFALKYGIRVQLNQDGLKLNGAHQLLVYADDVNILGRSIHTRKKNTEALVVAGKEI